MNPAHNAISFRWTPAARKSLLEVNAKIRARIEKGIERYALTGFGSVVPLHCAYTYRLSLGKYRVLFIKNNGEATIQNVLHRKDAYRNLKHHHSSSVNLFPR
jgi:mRNA-degrading endonuclease RelE of RelBE toxin-antitoxin system